MACDDDILTCTQIKVTQADGADILLQTLDWNPACRLLPQAIWWTGWLRMWRPCGLCLRLLLPWRLVAEPLQHMLKPPDMVRGPCRTAPLTPAILNPELF